MTIAVVAVARALASPTDPHPMSMLLQRCDTALVNIGVTDGLWTERDRGYLRSCADYDSTNLPDHDRAVGRVRGDCRLQ